MDDAQVTFLCTANVPQRPGEFCKKTKQGIFSVILRVRPGCIFEIATLSLLRAWLSSQDTQGFWGMSPVSSLSLCSIWFHLFFLCTRFLTLLRHNLKPTSGQALCHQWLHNATLPLLCQHREYTSICPWRPRDVEVWQNDVLSAPWETLSKNINCRATEEETLMWTPSLHI